MSIMKRCISFLLALVMVVGLLPQSILIARAEPLSFGTEAVAPDSEAVNPMSDITDGLVYVTWSDHVEITGYTGDVTEVVIPAEIKGLPVTSIGDRAFYWCSSLTSISIPDSVTSFGYEAFYYCSSLTSIFIPDSVIFIGNSAFNYCSSLNGIHVDDNNPFFSNDEQGVLFDKEKTQLIKAPGTITSYAIPENVTSISNNAFEGCRSLNSISVPERVSSICYRAFYNCDGLTSIDIPDSVTSIGDYAFYGCSGLTSFSIPDGVSAIGYGMFSNCFSLTSITIPDSVTSIGEWAFSRTGLTSISIPNSIISIGDYAFYNCSSLTSVTIPDRVEAIGQNAFSMCNNLNGIYVAEQNTTYSSDGFGVLFNKGKTELIQAPAMLSGSYIVPDGVGYVGGSAFARCKNLTSVTIPASVQELGSSTFSGCNNLAKIYFQGSAPKCDFYDETGESSCFYGLTATAYYPVDDSTWTTEVMRSYGGSITWIGVGELVGLQIVSAPEGGLLGQPLDLSDLSVELIYSNDLRILADNAELTIGEIDISTVGRKIVTISYGGVSSEFVYGVHEEGPGIILDPSLYPESTHNYENGLYESQTLTWPGATGLVLVFSPETKLEYDWDWIYVYDGADGLVASYTGTEAAGVSLEVLGDTVRILLVSDGSGNEYGYAFSSISTTSTVVHNGTDIIPAVEATCTESGYTEGFICEICDQAQYTVIPALGHDYESAVTAPTCTEPGYTTYTCSVCGDSYVADEVAPIGHIEGEAVRENEVAATCISEGSYEAVIYCTACGIEISRESFITATIDHSYDAEITDPTCTEGGYTTYTCSVCGDSYVADEVDSLGHNFEDGVCTRCGEVEPTEPEEEPIIITSQPADYVGMVGDTATFTVVAEGEGLKYQWYCSTDGGANWGTTGVIENTQSVVFLAYRNHQLYRCVITDAEGNTVASEAAELKAQEIALEITGQPENYIGAVGDEAVFVVEANGNGLTYEWFVSSDGGTTWVKSYMTGYMSDTQTAVLRAYRDGYKLYCKVSDVFGNTVDSAVVSMNVKSSEIVINSQPQSIENAAIQQMYAFTVEAEGDNLTYLWEVSTDGGTTWEQSWSDGYNTDTLNIRMYQYRDGYQYRCVVTSGLKTVVVTEAATLKLQAPSVAIESSPVSAYALLYEEVTMHVVATGMDLTYQWYYSTDDGSTWVENWMTGYNTDTLSIVAIPSREALYMCKVTDGSGTSVWSEPAQMKLLSAELKITSEPENFIGTVGDTAGFTVAVEGEGVSYRWYLSSDGGATWSECWFDGYNTNTLSFYINASRAANQYRCVVTDVAGNTVTSSTVTVVAE